MTKHKTKTRMFYALGFPIKLINVPMKKMLGEWVMDINYNALQLVVLKALVSKRAPLTKEELKFIRKFFEMTTTDFGKVLGVTHSRSSVGKRQEKIKPSPRIMHSPLRFRSSGSKG